MPRPLKLLFLAMLAEVAWSQALPDQTGVPPGMIKIQAASPSPGPAFDKLVSEMSAAYEKGEWVKAMTKADAALAIAERMVPLSTATQAACKLKDAKKANAYAARLKGIWKPTAGDLCIKDGIKLDGWEPMVPSPKHGYPLIVDEMNEAFGKGDWKGTLAKVEEALEHRLYEPEPYLVGTRASCKLKDARAANAYAAQLTNEARDSVRAQCAKDGVTLVTGQTH